MGKLNALKAHYFLKSVLGYLVLTLYTASCVMAQCCTCSLFGPELVLNGDFSLGNTAFTTSYTYGSNASPGRYGIATNPHQANNGWASCADHSSGTGNMMWVDLSGSSSINVWTQVVNNLQPHTQYLFSCWVTTLDLLGPGILQFAINGNLVGTPFTAPLTECDWIKFCVMWNSGMNTTATIRITNQSQFSSGNDIALDDISFRQCQLNTYNNVSVSICPNQSYTLPSGINVTTPGTYYDTLVSYLGCDSIIETNIVSSANLNDSVSVKSVSCFGKADGTLQIYAGGGQAPYTFNLHNIAINSNGGFRQLSAGNYFYTVTDQNGCSISNTCNIIEPDKVIISVSPDDTIIDINQSIQLNVTSNYSNTVLNWSPNLYLSCNTCTSTFTTPQRDITYLINGYVTIDGNQCIGETEITIATKPTFIIPQCFTPNNDGVNEYFTIYNSYPENIYSFRIMVHNRWGQKLYSSNDYNFRWYGAGEPGVYVYTINYQLRGGVQKNYVLKGTITVLK